MKRVTEYILGHPSRLGSTLTPQRCHVCSDAGAKPWLRSPTNFDETTAVHPHAWPGHPAPTSDQKSPSLTMIPPPMGHKSNDQWDFPWWLVVCGGIPVASLRFTHVSGSKSPRQPPTNTWISQPPNLTRTRSWAIDVYWTQVYINTRTTICMQSVRMVSVVFNSHL